MEPSASPIQEAIQALDGARQALDRAARALQQIDPRGRPDRSSRPPPRADARHAPADRLTARQLAAIRTACRREDISPEKLAELIAQVSERATEIVGLDRQEASALLDSLDAVTGYQR